MARSGHRPLVCARDAGRVSLLPLATAAALLPGCLVSTSSTSPRWTRCGRTRRPLPQLMAQLAPCDSPRAGRLATRRALPRAAPRCARDPGGSPRRPIHDGHEPDPPGALAQTDRWATIADAILNQLGHTAYRIKLKGGSTWKTQTPVDGPRPREVERNPTPASLRSGGWPETLGRVAAFVIEWPTGSRGERTLGGPLPNGLAKGTCRATPLPHLPRTCCPARGCRGVPPSPSCLSCRWWYTRTDRREDVRRLFRADQAVGQCVHQSAQPLGSPRKAIPPEPQ